MHNPFSRFCTMLLFSLVVLAVGCGGNSTPTPTPTVPPAEFPTAIPVTLAPTSVTVATPTLVIQPTLGIPTATALVPSPTPTENASGTPPPAPVGGGGGIFITRLRADPPTPRNKELTTFLATFVNTTGHDQYRTWCVEVYRPGEKKSFGISRCDLKTIPPGTSEQATAGWQITGIRECIPIRARAVIRDELDVRTPFVQPNGRALWLDMNACP